MNDSVSSDVLATQIAQAHTLADRNVPVFCARLDAEGNPDTRDRRWKQWEKTPAGSRSHRAIDSWKPGEGLGAVTGTAYDVLDPDLYKPGAREAFGRLSKELGANGPEVYWEIKTPQGGRHLYIAPLGIGSHNGFMPGIDLKGGKPDGSSRGFVFIPPTQRKGGIYVAKGTLAPVNGYGPCIALADVVQRETGGDGSGPTGAARRPLGALRDAVLKANVGHQREALLQLVHEMERQGKSQAEMTEYLREFLPTVRLFKPGPWYPARGRDPDKHIKSLFHKPGVVIPDATDEEAAELEEIKPQRAGRMRNFSQIERRKTQWLWKGHIARGDMTVIDGEKGCGKSLVVEDIAARLSAGRPMPGEETGTGEAINIAIYTSESGAEEEVGPRLDAAEAVIERIWCPKVRKDKLGKAVGYVLPDAALEVQKDIQECNAGLSVFDPVNDFLAEDINTHNDASIRRALGPLGQILQETRCAGLLIRHVNKDTNASAKTKGAGGMAYQNISRVHIFIGRLPEGSHPVARFGLGVIDSNKRKVVPGVLAYDITDSDIEQDLEGGMVARIEWYGLLPSISVDDLARGKGPARRGPKATVEADAIEIVKAMFRGKTLVPAKEITAAWDEAGISYDGDLKGRVKDALLLRSVRRKDEREKEAGAGWDWVRIDPMRRPRRRG